MDYEKLVERGIDISPEKRVEWNYRYATAFSKHLTSPLIGKPRKIANDRVCREMANLAKSGDLKALSFFFQNVEMESLDPDLKEMAEKIESKTSPKSPEEWQVVAALHSLDPVYLKDDVFPEFSLMIDEDLVRIRKAILLMTIEMRLYDENITPDENTVHISCSALNNSKYIEAIKNAQLGYFCRYLETDNLFDLCSYLETRDGVLRLYEEYNLRNEITDTNGISYWQFAYILKEICKNDKKKKIILDKTEAFAVAYAFELISKTTVGCVNSRWTKKTIETFSAETKLPSIGLPDPSYPNTPEMHL